MRTVHRVVSLFVVLFTLYLGITGTLMQIVDLRTLYSHAPATNPNMRAIREGFDGPDGFASSRRRTTLRPYFPRASTIRRPCSA